MAHGIIDYGLVTALLTVPHMLGLKDKTARMYQTMGAGLGVYNALTDHGAAVKPLIPFQTHYKIDYGNLFGIASLALLKTIRKSRKALMFHTAFIAAATVTVVLTNWKAGSSGKKS